MLNNLQTKQLFEKEAILFGERDGIPASRVIELFGEEALAFAHHMNKDSHNQMSIYGIGGTRQVDFITFRGLQTVVTYCNVVEVLEKEDRGAKCRN